MHHLLFPSLFLFAFLLIGNTYKVLAHPSPFEPQEDPPAARLLQQHNVYKQELFPYETPMKTSELLNAVVTPRAVRY